MLLLGGHLACPVFYHWVAGRQCCIVGKSFQARETEQEAGSHHWVADPGQITRGLNGNNNIYPRGLSWGLKEMCSAWNTIDLQLIEAAIITSYIFLLAVYLLLAI